MCDLKKEWKFINALNCKYVIDNPGKGEFVVRGHIQGGIQKLVYYASSPATYNSFFQVVGYHFQVQKLPLKIRLTMALLLQMQMVVLNSASSIQIVIIWP